MIHPSVLIYFFFVLCNFPATRVDKGQWGSWFTLIEREDWRHNIEREQSKSIFNHHLNDDGNLCVRVDDGGYYRHLISSACMCVWFNCSNHNNRM